MKAFFKSKKDREMEYGETFNRNGGLVLEKLIGFNKGKCNPIRGFSATELERATNNYEARQLLCEDGYYKLYKGLLQDRPILVKKFEETSPFVLSFAINEIPFASHMSVHKNVLKLLGCCLETKIPILVFESVKNGTLHDHLYSPNVPFKPLLWKHRLKIAVDIANVVTYLHTAFSKPIIHKGIIPLNILLDEHCVAKLTDFSLSISIPDGETHVEDTLNGIMGYLDHEYLQTSRFNEMLDVYSFGIVLLVLLTGKKSIDISDDDWIPLVTYVEKYIEGNRFNEIIDPIIVGEGPWPGKEHELLSFAALAFRCASSKAEDRPAMIDVAKELMQMYRSRSFPI